MQCSHARDDPIPDRMSNVFLIVACCEVLGNVVENISSICLMTGNTFMPMQ